MQIDSGKLFPLQFQFFAVLIAFGSVASIGFSWALSIVLAVLSVTILTARSGFIIDKNEKRYREYSSFLFLKTGTWENYANVDVLFINLSKVTQKLNSAHTSTGITTEGVEYNGYLKFGNGEKVHIDSSKKKKVIIEKLNRLAAYLNVDIMDYTH
jgi:hypothetical protein